MRRFKKKTRTANPFISLSYHCGGRMPLSDVPTTTLTVTLSDDLLKRLRDLSENFINPSRLLPYGLSALCRVLIQREMLSIMSIKTQEKLRISQKKGTPGRLGVGINPKRRLLILTKRSVECFNERAIKEADPLVGAASICRWVLTKAINDMDPLMLYEHIPQKDKIFMSQKGLSPTCLIAAYKNKLGTQA